MPEIQKRSVKLLRMSNLIIITIIPVLMLLVSMNVMTFPVTSIIDLGPMVVKIGD